MTPQAHQNRDKIESIRHRLNAGVLTYDQAKKEAQPIIDQMNKRAKEIADQHGVKHRPLSFRALMR